MQDTLGMMKKPRARLCKQYAALPLDALGKIALQKKVESLQVPLDLFSKCCKENNFYPAW